MVFKITKNKNRLKKKGLYHILLPSIRHESITDPKNRKKKNAVSHMMQPLMLWIL